LAGDQERAGESAPVIAAADETAICASALILIAKRMRIAMPEIPAKNGIVTQITTVTVAPDKQDEALRVMKERAKFMATQPGFVSISLHRSKDGAEIVNYVQWKNREQLEAAHHSPEFRERWPEFGKLVREAEPKLYELVMVEEK
jgi:heme-degrading monooxygenase HmoA